MATVERLRSFSSASYILGATAVSGLCGYLVTGIVAGVLGPADYAIFAVFWSALYLIVGGLTGIQQEITRGTHPLPTGDNPTGRARTFAIGASGTVLVLVLGSSVLWAPAVFPEHRVVTAIVLSLGTACYVFVSTISGILYGLSLWIFIALMVALDGVTRLVFVGLALLLQLGEIGLEAATVMPFLVVPLILWFWVRPRIVGRYRVDVAMGGLVWNAIRAIVASAATAVLVSGFPLLVGASARGTSSATVGAFLLAVTLTRAPLVVTFLALQSYFVVLFRGRGHQPGPFWRLMGLLAGGVAVVSVVFAALALWLGEAVFVAIFGPDYAVSGVTLALLVLTSGLVALLAISGSALLARGAHSWFAASWLVTAAATIIVVSGPGELIPRALAALAIGPSAGLVLQAIGNLLVERDARRLVSADRDRL